MRLIDADVVLQKLALMLNYCESRTMDREVAVLFQVADAVMDCPTIEAEPVRHGRWEECDWVEYDGHIECVRYPKKGRVCTNCRNAFKKEFIDNPRVHCCPHCGARMDGDSHA